MPVINRIADFHEDMCRWRRDFHAHPELAFEETRTAGVVCGLLREFGMDVHQGLATTGVVGTLRTGDGPVIGLRADLDALPLEEKNKFQHRSCHAGKMHACGHDGHTSMLLGAARYLAETRRFKGTVHFIFQPAEEEIGGARVMIEEGLFEKFPCESVYGMHNMPGYAAGSFALRSGPMMAACDTFELRIGGRGSHAAMPHQGIDSIVVAAQIVTALQTICSRNTAPVEAAVVSVTRIHGGAADNVIPDEVVLRGTTRAFTPRIRDSFEPNILRIAGGIAAAHGARVELDYQRGYPATVNHARETAIATAVAVEISGTERVDLDPPPTMGGEDFAYMLEAKPGCYIFIGNGPGEGGCLLHNPHYDFNDDILTTGASYWARLVERELPLS